MTRNKKRLLAELRADHFCHQAGKCFYCQKTMNLTPNGWPDPAFCTVDHIVPLSRGGKKDGQTVGACQYCNNRRGNMPWLDFVAIINRRKNA